MIQIDNNFENLNKYLIDIVRKNIYSNRKKVVNSCPKCGKNHYIKYGFFKGVQRYRCKDCGKTFSLVTNSIWSYSKKEPSKWIKFIELMLEKRTLKYCSEKLEININTAFYWRHKVLHALTFCEIPDKLIGNVHMIKASTKENFKGNKHIDTDIREKVYMVSARGEEDSILCLPVCKKIWDIKKFNEKVYSKVSKKSLIIPYVDRYIRAIAERHNEKIYNINKELSDNRESDEFISKFNLLYKTWFKSFYGIATKYLEKYLCWFVIFFLHKKFININFFYELLNGVFFEKIKDISI
ncbi:MAG: IS1 family transposase [Clostridium sp.]|nr:IS1 family transposase [Clostridium sp.]